jgi:stage II sporulation protein D
MLGVVPAEIGGLSPELLEAGRAQAIAARSYTLFYRGRRGTEGFDLYGTVEDQVYGPIENERPLATRCVETTRGSIAISKSGPIRANYCSTCGGITSDVWEAWPADPLSYLVGHRDRGPQHDYCVDSPHYRWREEWRPEEFLSDIATYGPPEGVAVPAGGIGELRDARIAARSRSGRAWRVSVETTTGTVEIPAYALRRVLRRPGNPAQILRSTLIKIGVLRDPRTHRVLAVVVSGAGSGHGVGLCQTGAIGMARAGNDANHILLHYYSGVEIKRFY